MGEMRPGNRNADWAAQRAAMEAKRERTMGGAEEEEKKRLGEPEGMEAQAEAAPVFPTPPVVYECGTCGKNVRIKNDIVSPRNLLLATLLSDRRGRL